MCELVALLKNKFPDEVWSDKKAQAAEKILASLRLNLTCEDITTIINYSHNISLILTLQDNLLNVLQEAGILQEVNFLFSNDYALVYASNDYFNAFVDVCSRLQANQQLTTQHLRCFFSNQACFLHYDEIKEALNEWQKNSVTITFYHIETLFNFPEKASVIATLWLNREESHSVAGELAESDYSAHMMAYFSQHQQDNFTFGFNQSLARHVNRTKKRNRVHLWKMGSTSKTNG